jgi:cyclophilin family peptidyl-prolyl cis-trans isomerase
MRRRLRRSVTRLGSTAAVVFFGFAGCARAEERATHSAPDAGNSSLAAIARLELAADLRRAEAIGDDDLSGGDPLVRRAAARAFARILNGHDAPLIAALEDEDSETVAWAAFGLGESCRDDPDSHVRALALRLHSLAPPDGGTRPMEALRSVLRALGRCATVASERTLAAWLDLHLTCLPFAEEAAYALGELSVARGSLVSETVDVLLGAMASPAHLDAALYPFGRSDVGMGARQKDRLRQAARDALGRAGSSRIFAVGALMRLGADSVGDLSRILMGDSFDFAERSEAAHALATIEGPGIQALGQALAALQPVPAQPLTTDAMGMLLAVLDGIPRSGAAGVDAALQTLATIPTAPEASEAERTRASALRCAAAAKFAEWDSDVASGCDRMGGQAGKLARLAMLDHTELEGDRREAWIGLTRAPEPARVRETAISLIGRHPETWDAAPTLLSEALAASEPGIVQSAAEVIHSHPERAWLSPAPDRRRTRRQRHSAVVAPAKTTPSPLPAALRAALERPWADDLVDPPATLIDVAMTLGLDDARTLAKAACGSPNFALRARAAKALAAAGENPAACREPVRRDRPEPEVGHSLAAPVRVRLETDSTTLVIRLDPAFAPVEATRIAALARARFFDRLVIHRAAPGLVAQFGDPAGDGYGGTGRLLRSEMSPVPFGELDVGIALLGRDTGSSQIFVSLSRAPHLDGRYPWIGHAEGDWEGVVEGEVIRSVTVEP